MSTSYWLDESAPAFPRAHKSKRPDAIVVGGRSHRPAHARSRWRSRPTQQTPDRLLVAGRWRDTALETENTAVEETAGPVQAQIDERVRELLGLPLVGPTGAKASGSRPATPATAT